MDGTSVTFGKQDIRLSRKYAVLIIAIFIACLIAIGFIVYLSTTCPDAHLPAQQISVETPTCNETQSTTTDIRQSSSPPTNTPTTKGSTALPAFNENVPKKEPIDVRLPKSIQPDSYDIKIVPYIYEGNFTFDGEVTIRINVIEVTSNITLHFDDIDVDLMTLSVQEILTNDVRIVEIKDISNDTSRQFLIIQLNEPLRVNKQYEVHMMYKGVLNDILQGFYRSSYTVNNQTRWIAATQFQPTDARKAFPCFDEPAMKAKFRISLARPANMSTLSNMPQTGEHQPVENLPDYVWDYYEKSVPMSTYLVAFAVTDFGKISTGNFSVWARKEALSQANYSLSIGPKILAYYEQFFQIPFPLPKMDMIALPDFAAGAMENWGLITYRETAMLYEEGVSTSLNLQRIATVIAHELAHQWFGNLVTPVWWSDLWLNEGFATYVEYIGANAVEPDWKILDQFVVQQLHYAFTLDALKSSHKISIEVGHPDEINDLFDRISYAKGASIIRMMNYFLTEEVLKKGLTYYLNSRKYSNAEQNDLWDALTLHAHKYNILHSDVTVKQIMDTWTLQLGFPVVTVTRDYKTKSASLTQQHFLLLNTGSNTSDLLWWIPITYTNEKELNFKNTTTKQWMQNVAKDVISDVGADENQWILLNVQQTGYYRVNYDVDNWKMLIEHLRDSVRFKEISAINRAQLLNDALNLAQANILDYDIALNVTTYLTHERDYVPWQAAFSAFSYIDVMFIRTGHYDKFKDYILKLIDGLYKEIGFHDKTTDPQLTIYKRIDVLQWACTLGLYDCVSNSVVQFQNWRGQPNPDINNPISPNLKGIVYCTALRVGGENEWEFAWERYINSNVGSEREILLNAMGCSRETWILSRYLDWAVTENSGIRKQDAPRVFATVASNPIGQNLAFDFLRNNWLRIREYMSSSLTVINSIVRVCTKNRNTVFEMQSLKDFANKYSNDLGTATRTIQQAIEDAEANVHWMDHNYQEIVNWLLKLKTKVS